VDETRDQREPVHPAGRGDGARSFARDLRLTLVREHLDRPADGSADPDLIDPDSFMRAVRAAADRLNAWHAAGRAGRRPPGRLRPHQPEKLPLPIKAWSIPVYRLVYDPDGSAGAGPAEWGVVSSERRRCRLRETATERHRIKAASAGAPVIPA
jgi:hypothetical protein